MDRAAEDRPDDDPDQGRGAVEGPEDRAEDGAEAGDVEKLDEKNLGRRHLHVVDPVGRSGPASAGSDRTPKTRSTMAP